MKEMDVSPLDAWKAVYEVAKGLDYNHKKTALMKMRKSNGELAKNDKENAQVFKEHLNVLYNQVEKTDYDPTILEQLDRIEPEPNLGIPSGELFPKCNMKKPPDQTAYRPRHTRP